MKNHPFKASTLALAMSMALAWSGAAGADTLKKPALDALAQAQPRPADFAGFLRQAAASQPEVAQAVQRHAAGAALAGDDLTNIARLLGLYTRLTQEQAVLSSIERMVALPTVRDPKVAPHESPAILAFGALVQQMAKDFGLQYRNVDNRIFEVTLPANAARATDAGADEFGILTHADVVPVVPAEWVLDGQAIDPFKVTRVGDKLYGRGTIDDKGSIATVLFAMKAVKDSGLPLSRGIRLMIETTEETGGDAMKYYQGKTTLPAYNIVLDSKYPAVVAEKGSGALKAVFDDVKADPAVPAITAMAGAASANAIAQTATAGITATDEAAIAAIAARLEAAKGDFTASYAGQGGPFAIDIQRSGTTATVKVTGASAHGSRPEEGVNPVPRLTLFLQQVLMPTQGVALVQSNAYTQAVRYINGAFGLDYLGKQLGVAYADDFMGPLTLSPNLIKAVDGKLEVTTNVRMPRGKTPEQLQAEVQQRITRWSEAAKVPLSLQYTQGHWMARDPKGAWLATLLNIFGDTTGLDARPVSTAGSTTAKFMPNAINFGPAMPGKKYTAHNALEYKEVPDLRADMQMFTEMLVRIGNLKQMQ
ncbi:Beta-Ala-Xaa dipeptidase [Delftia tsuruhatensis]|uniref:dipeptidase n=1 Tax=Delftia tsuruhatensis TaxID=180282 RepID=UPI001E7339DE|nr:dipeptidase [Delftia tsuruhatensis]CAB5718317.1 Beta-Ala-Xaa dipeptidase [Delftia tsuruhatensis]CAC9692442.1 Beta-Ala-Xaa dipeptidase [Delftia tsuruhatensis]